MTSQHDAIAAVQARFPQHAQDSHEFVGQAWIYVAREAVVPVLTLLRDEHGFDMLMDFTAVDWLGKDAPERFDLVYILFSSAQNEYLRVKVRVPEDDAIVDTACSVYKAANWAEREIFDLYGIRFGGHPNLKRILLPDGYQGHPLRKDYPTTGHGERHDFSRYRET